jgi:hypothetical protein
LVATKLRPRCVDQHLVVWRLIGIPTNRALTYGAARTYRKCGSSMILFNRVALRGSRGASTVPLTKLFSGALHKLFAGFDGDHHQAV